MLEYFHDYLLSGKHGILIELQLYSSGEVKYRSVGCYGDTYNYIFIWLLLLKYDQPVALLLVFYYYAINNTKYVGYN